jgi:hypothetical protein
MSAGRQLAAIPTSPMSDTQSRGPFVGSLMAMLSYLLSNQMSDSFGPSTLPFFYLFLGLSTFFVCRNVPDERIMQRNRSVEPKHTQQRYVL